MQITFINLTKDWPSGVAVCDCDPDSAVLIVSALLGFYSGDRVQMVANLRSGIRKSWIGEADRPPSHAWAKSLRMSA